MIAVKDSRTTRSLCVLLTGILIHSFMVMVPGAWWDDYKFFFCDNSQIRQHMTSAGRLDAYCLILPVNWLPIAFFRIVVILCFAVSAVLIFWILLEVIDNKRAAFWIATLYNAIPVNDIRIMKCVYPYTVALLLFWIASYMLLKIRKEMHKQHRVVTRILSLLFFFISFSTNSLLVFYTVPILALWYCSIKDHSCQGKRPIKRIFFELLKYVDFYMLPFLFFFCEQQWGSPDPNGLYSNYNVLTIEKCIAAFRVLPKSIITTSKEIILNEIRTIISHKWIAIAFIIIITGEIYRSIKDNPKISNSRTNIIGSLAGFISGIIFFVIGMYPYVAIGRSVIGTRGKDGRDALLVCLGASMMVFYFTELIRISKWLQTSTFFLIITTSTIYFSISYAGYLRDHYDQMALEYSWLQTDDVKNGNTFLYLKQDGEQSIGDSFYSLAAMATIVYSDSTRFISPGLSTLQYVTTYEKKELIRNDATYGYSQYDLDDIDIDGAMIVSYKLGCRDAVVLRLYEWFDCSLYQEKLLEIIDYQYVPMNKQQSDAVYDGYLKGTISDDQELIELIESWSE